MPDNNIKKDAPAVTGQGAPGTAGCDSAAGTIILHDSPGSQAVSGQKSTDSGSSRKGRFKRDKTHVLGIDSSVSTLAMKFYDEQLPGQTSVYNGAGFLIQHDPNAVPNFIAAIHATDPKEFQVLAIRHDRDEVTDGIWAVAKVKPHWHVIVRLVNQNRRIRVRQILAGLGVVYRRGLDDELWTEHGVETIGNFAGYAVYLTHETAEAIRDAKERYDVSEIVSNLSAEEIQQVREGYIRVSEKRKLTQEDLIALDKEAYDRGYALKTLHDWFADQPFNVRSAAKIKVITEHYYHGVEARISKHEQIDRVCIYIQGEPNKGKTYAAEHALLDMGLNPFRVKGGGTGKFDDLSAAHDSILIDDDTCPNLLNMTDDYVCQAYKRGRNNPPWTGKMFIVTGNMPFRDWLDLCGMRLYKRDRDGGLILDAQGQPVLTDKGKSHLPAMLSRFFLMHIETDAEGVSRLRLDPGQNKPDKLRGAAERQQAKIDMAVKFCDIFNSIICQYRPNRKTPDFSAFDPDEYNRAAKEPERRFDAWMELLTDFALWFWGEYDGGFAWYMEHTPQSWDDPALDARLATDDDALMQVIDAVISCFSGTVTVDGQCFAWRDMHPRYPQKHILDAVKSAWQGWYGECEMLYDQSTYPAWVRQVFGVTASERHKVCRKCWHTAFDTMHYCGVCGERLPDEIFTGDPRFTVAQLQIAAERGCDRKDVSHEDVKNRVLPPVRDNDKITLGTYSPFRDPHPIEY